VTITSKIIEYTKGPTYHHPPLLTVEVRYPRFIHAELMTHRVFSRNAASSRAIKTEKLIADVIADPAMPTFWGKNQPGMSAKEECDAPVRLHAFFTDSSDPDIGIWTRESYDTTRDVAWLKGRDRAVELAISFMSAGYHKQIVNRILEPWAHITVCITSTSWANFFALRDHPDAQPEIQVLARAIKDSLKGVEPKALTYGEWHMPYVTSEDRGLLSLEDQIKLSVARCASTSYRTVDGNIMTQERALALHDRLVASEPLHASPTEHQARPDIWNYGNYEWNEPKLHGNFTGYIQHRKTLANEYVKD